MPGVIQLKRRVTGTIAPVPTPINAGEPHFSVPGFTGGGPNALWIDTGAAVVPLVDRTRQVELAGAQTITGPKTFAAGATLTLGQDPVAALEAATKAYVDGATTFTWGTGLTETTPGTIDMDQATQTVPGGGMISTAALIAAGASDTTLISPLGLRSQLGADAATLVTTAKSVVPGMNEIYTRMEQLVGVVIFAGTYDAATNLGTFNGQGGITAGAGVALPAASTANHGAYVIVTVAGTGAAPAPVEPIAVGDWLQSDGTGWMRLAFAQPMGAYLPLSGGVLTGPIFLSGSIPIDIGGAPVAPGSNATGTALNIRSGSGDGIGVGGELRLSAGGSTGYGGPVYLTGGASTGSRGGYVNLIGGPTSSTDPTQQGGITTVSGGSNTGAGKGGHLNLNGGDSVAAGMLAGNISLRAGQNTTDPLFNGSIVLPNLSTVAQANVNAIWNNNGALNIGAGAIVTQGATFFDPTTFTGDGLSAATQITLATVDGGVF